MEVYNRVATGVLKGNTGATQMPDVACRMVCFKALTSNTGDVYIGVAGVTASHTATNATTGYELSPGEQSTLIPISNLNLLYYICDGADDDLTYMAMG